MITYQKFIKAYNTAVKLAQESDMKFRLCAVALDKNGQIISYGVNKRKTHPLQGKYAADQYKIYLHAEIDCITKEDKEVFRGSTLFVVRKRNDGKHGCSRPCSGCMRMLRDYGFKSVVYFNEEGRFTEEYLGSLSWRNKN
jgi:deoxycytidylate deaminase